MPTKPLIIPLSRRKILLLTLGAWAFVALGIWLWTIADAQRRHHPLFVKAAAVAAIAFFGLCGACGWVKIFDRKPGLVIDGEGIVDNASGLAAGRIEWSEIAAVEVSSISNRTFVTIVVTDPQKYLKRGNFLTRMFNQANLRLTGSPINIPASALDVGFEELHRALRSAFEEYQGSESTQITRGEDSWLRS